MVHVHNELVRIARRLLLGLAAAAVASAWTPMPAAHAFPEGPDEALTTSVVTRLTLDDDGVGWLTVHPRFHTIQFTGFDVSIPAGDGAWTGPARVPVPELGTVCVLDPGPDLHYRCGRTRTEDPEEQMPAGAYQVSFRVRHTGSTAGPRGTSSVFAVTGYSLDYSQEYVGSRDQDTFPVYRASHFRSSAEVRMVPVDWPDWPDWSRNLAQISTSVTVVPGERVTALDLDLGGHRWRAIGSNAARHGMQCFVRRVAAPSLHCTPAPGRDALPAGRFQLVIDLAYGRTSSAPFPFWHSEARSSVTLTVDGGMPAVVDDFYWTDRELY